MFLVSLSLLFPLCFSITGRAANDWSSPCFSGECSYDIPASQSSGTLRIWGASDAISDITPAAGWAILDCVKGAMAQDIRVVCTDGQGCEHLAQTTGSGVGKIVRLPENCGQSAFALITKQWVHHDQTLPPALASQLRQRSNDGSLPQVKGLSLDANFNNVEHSSAGPINFAIHGLTQSVPPLPSSNQRRSRTRRTPRSQSEIQDRSVVSVLQQAFNGKIQFFQSGQSTMQKLKEVDLKKTFPLFSDNISCPAVGKVPAFEASVSGSVDACIVANITLTVSAVGTLLPANFTKFGLVVGLDADLEGTLKVAGSASATLDSGAIDLITIGIPGLDFPGILTIGPSFKVQAQATATLDVGVDLSVDLSYCISGAKFFYPPSPFNKNSGKFTPNNSPLNFSVAPNVSSKAKLEAHIIPSLDFGITAINGLASANIFLDVDTSSTMTLSLDGSANVEGGGTTKSGIDITSKQAQLDGCVDIGAGLAIDAGADGQFFDIFDFAPKVNLFTKNFDFFKKCFGVQANSTKREAELPSISDFGHYEMSRSRVRRRDLATRALTLTCPPSSSADSTSKLVSVANSVIGSSSIKLKN
ncbi:hypothetical protein MIND_00588300 [Mycena indigotica]|uniref:DUF7223 domain-containing protein n=1 Tax=Mycena indigotica TaxID=2126181 RepID=A0A8H6SPG1_9AGAR|nr:uncharacterized protein MIND_00588300 [Mycena indigotica]KAF7303590.1 hypothetical protein MIND_00588300 [Mycena indigotica]